MKEVQVVEPIKSKDDIKKILGWFHDNYPKYEVIFSLEQEIKELRNKLDKLETQVNDKNKIGRYIPNYGDTYFYVDSNFIKSAIYNNYYISDQYRKAIGNCFRTKEEAEKYKRILINKQKLKDLAFSLNDGEEVDWNNNCTKYFLYLDKRNLDYGWQTANLQMQGVVYCLNKKFLEKAKEEIGEEELIELIKG